MDELAIALSDRAGSSLRQIIGMHGLAQATGAMQARIHAPAPRKAD